MKSTSRRRLALAAGLLLVALLVSAIGAQVAFAINDVGTGSGGVPTSRSTRQAGAAMPVFTWAAGSS